MALLLLSVEDTLGIDLNPSIDHIFSKVGSPVTGLIPSYVILWLSGSPRNLAGVEAS